MPELQKEKKANNNEIVYNTRSVKQELANMDVWGEENKNVSPEQIEQDKKNYLERILSGYENENLKLQAQADKKLDKAGSPDFAAYGKKKLRGRKNESYVDIKKKKEDSDLKKAKKTFAYADVYTVREMDSMKAYVAKGGYKKIKAENTEGDPVLTEYVKSILSQKMDPSVLSDDYISSHAGQLCEYALKLRDLKDNMEKYPDFFEALSDAEKSELISRSSVSEDLMGYINEHMQLHGVTIEKGKKGIEIALRKQAGSRDNAARREAESRTGERKIALAEKIKECKLKKAAYYTEGDNISSAKVLEGLDKEISEKSGEYSMYRQVILDTYEDIKKTLILRDEEVARQRKHYNRGINPDFVGELDESNRKLDIMSKNIMHYKKVISCLLEPKKFKTLSKETKAFMEREKRFDVLEIFGVAINRIESEEAKVKAVKRIKIPRAGYNISVAPAAAYERQKTNNCYACSGAAIFNRFIQNTDGKLNKVYKQKDIRNFVPDYKKWSEVSDVILQGPQAQKSEEDIKFGKQIYASYLAGIRRYAGEGKNAVGNIFELGDFFVTKRNDVAVNRMVFNTPALERGKKSDLDVRREGQIYENQKAAFLRQVNEVLATGNMVSVLRTNGESGHYTTIVGIEGRNLKVLDSTSSNPNKTDSISVSDILTRRSKGNSIEITWLSKMKDPQEMKAEFSNLEYDEEKGYSAKEVTMESALNLGQKHGVLVSKTAAEMGEGMENISYSVYIPKHGKKAGAVKGGAVKQGEVKQEAAKKEEVKKETVKQEAVKKETVKKEAVKKEEVQKEEVQKEEAKAEAEKDKEVNKAELIIEAIKKDSAKKKESEEEQRKGPEPVNGLETSSMPNILMTVRVGSKERNKTYTGSELYKEITGSEKKESSELKKVAKCIEKLRSFMTGSMPPLNSKDADQEIDGALLLITALYNELSGNILSCVRNKKYSNKIQKDMLNKLAEQCNEERGSLRQTVLSYREALENGNIAAEKKGGSMTWADVLGYMHSQIYDLDKKDEQGKALINVSGGGAKNSDLLFLKYKKAGAPINVTSPGLMKNLQGNEQNADREKTVIFRTEDIQRKQDYKAFAHIGIERADYSRKGLSLKPEEIPEIKKELTKTILKDFKTMSRVELLSYMNEIEKDGTFFYTIMSYDKERIEKNPSSKVGLSGWHSTRELYYGKDARYKKLLPYVIHEISLVGFHQRMSDQCGIAEGRSISARHVATSRVATFFGLQNMVCDSRNAYIKEGGQLKKGVVMEHSGGIQPSDLYLLAKKNKKKVKYSEKAISETFAMQMLDVICGQMDRHQANFHVTYKLEGDTYIVTGVRCLDNDMSFGNRKFDLTKTNNRMRPVSIINLAGLPIVVLNRIMSAQPQFIYSILGDLLSKKEMDCVIERLEYVKQEIRNFEKQGALKYDEKKGEYYYAVPNLRDDGYRQLSMLKKLDLDIRRNRKLTKKSRRLGAQSCFVDALLSDEGCRIDDLINEHLSNNKNARGGKA